MIKRDHIRPGRVDVDFDSGKSARKSWFLLQTPVYLVVGLLRLLGKNEHEVKEGASSLKISQIIS